jgi:hypothetical protein
MAEKFIVKYGVVTQNIDFQSPDHNNTIAVEMLNTDELTFTGDIGTILSLRDAVSGTVLTINDANANSSIELDSDGTIRLAETTGNVLIGTATDNTTDKLQVNGSVIATSFSGNGSALTNIDADTLDGQAGSYYLDFTNFTNIPDPQITVTLTGDVTGTGNATLTDLGNGSISFATTIAANSVALGTDTTGNYVATISGTANEIEVTNSGSESAAVTIGLPNNVTIGNNLTVTGNLTVNGTTTTVNTETINLADNIITLNSNYTGSAPTENGGIEIERGTLANTVLRWNETNDRWEFTNDGSTYYNIPLPAEYGNANDATITLSAGTALSGGGSFTTDQATNGTITFNHANVSRNDSTSTATPGYGSNFTVVDSVTSNAQGHITAINVKTVTFPASDNTDNYVDSLSFNTGTGVLTVGRTGALADLTVDLDGRYLESQNSDYGVITVTDTDTGYTWSETGNATADNIGDTITFVSGTNVDIDIDTTNAAVRISSIDTQPNDATITLSAGTYISGGGNFTTDQATNETITFNHDTTSRSDTTSTASPAHGGTVAVVDSVTTNTTGHVTAINVKTITLPADNNTTNLPVENSSGTVQFTATNTTGIQFAASGSASVAFDAANQRVTIGSTDTNTDNYVSGVAFNTTTGVLTLDRTGALADLTVDLDGRYLELAGGALTGSVSTTSNISLSDNSVLNFGTDNDLQIFYSSTGNISYIKDNGSGHLRLQGSEIAVVNFANDEYMARFLENSAVNLYHNGVLKLETTANGITVTGLVSSTTLETTGNCTIGGNLTVNGTTTTVNTETINLADNIITLNSNYTGSAPTEDAGIEVERGTQTNVNIIWDESEDRWRFTNDGSTYYNLPIDSELGTSPNNATITLSAGTYIGGGGSFTTDQATNGTITFNHDTTTRTDTTSTASPTFGNSFNVIDGVTTNTTGHVTAVNVKTVTLPASDNTDNYVDSVSFATGTGILTLGRTGALADLTVDLDGRYLQAQSTDFKTITVTDTDSGYTWAATGSAVAEAVGDTLTIVSGANVNIDVDSTNDAIRISSTDTNTLPNNATITLSAGTYISGGGDFTTDQASNETLTFNHDSTTRTDTTSTASPTFGGTITVVDGVTTNTTGHVTAVNVKTVTLPASDNTDNYVDSVSFNTADGVLTLGRTGSLADLTVDLDGRYSTANTTNFNIQANGGTQVNISAGEEINFINGTYTTAAVVNQANPTVTFNHNNTTRSDSTSTASPAAGGTFTAVDSVTTNATGHVTAINVKTVTVPSGSSVTTSDSPPGTPSTGDLWWDSDQGSLHVYYDGFWVESNPSLGVTSNPQFNSLGIGTAPTGNSGELVCGVLTASSGISTLGSILAISDITALNDMRSDSLGVGTAASGTSGEIRATNDVTAYYSDARLKDFEGKIDSALDKVNSLNGYYFRENERARELGYNNPNRQVGVSAQEVEAVLPEIVTEAPIDPEYKTVKYEKLAPLFVEAIKELDSKYAAIIEQQQAQINTLINEINRLRGDN